MNKITKKIYMLPLLAATLTLGSCVEMVEPTDSASSNQVNGSSESFAMLVNGLKAKMIAWDTYGSDEGSYAEALADWGYPCYMIMRDVMLDGMPTTGSSWNYQYSFEAATGLSGYSGYPYYYYYNFINNANRILKTKTESDATAEMKQSLAIVRTYRALCYMQLTSMYEYFKTGIAELDQKAEANGVMGLTVPLVTETTTPEESKNNPRVPFYKMYRFIHNDLAIAEQNIGNYERTEKNDINKDVINGMMARFWLTAATRFDRQPDDLAAQVQHEQDEDGLQPLGITTANDCYKKATEYAQKVINAGYLPVTESEWNDASSGFNTANQAWVWDLKYSSTEQTPRYWCTLTGIYASEPTWAMPAYSGEYRCISKALYDKIGKGDWRKNSWVAPEDAGSQTVPAKYQTKLANETSASLSANTNWSRLPAYANLKFRAAGGNMDVEDDGLLVTVPLMRVEEMYFIKMEAALHTDGLAAAKSQLENFLNTYRYEDGSYTCKATTNDGFIQEMIAQKYIEFWGEDVLFNDYKRLGLQVNRMQDDTNYLEAYQLKSKSGYTAPWMNFYIPEVERSFNKGVVMNPDPVSYIQQYCK